MPNTSRSRRIRLLFLSAGVAAAIWALAPRGAATGGSVRPAADRKAIASFTLPAVGGGRWSLAEHRGQVILLNFWATWCPPCREETPGLVEIQNRYSGRGFSVVGVSMDDNPQSAVPAFAKRYGITYPILAPTSDFGLAGSVDSIPTSFLIDREGRVARTYYGAVGTDTLSADIEQLLSDAGPLSMNR